MYTLIVKSSFDAAHFIPDYPGKCARIHGHTWNIEVEIEGMELDNLHMVVDFGIIKKELKEILPDHQFLNEYLPIKPTAENLSKYLYTSLRERFSDRNFNIKSVLLWESPDCGCKYSEK